MTKPKGDKGYLQCAYAACGKRIPSKADFVIGRGGFIFCGEKCSTRGETELSKNNQTIKIRVAIPVETHQAIERLVKIGNYDEPISNTKGRILNELLKIGLANVDENGLRGLKK